MYCAQTLALSLKCFPFFLLFPLGPVHSLGVCTILGFLLLSFNDGIKLFGLNSFYPCYLIRSLQVSLVKKMGNFLYPKIELTFFCNENCNLKVTEYKLQILHAIPNYYALAILKIV